jgi:integrase
MSATIQAAGHPRYPFVVLYPEGECQRKKYFKTRRAATEWKAKWEASHAHVAPNESPASPEEHRAVVEARSLGVPLMEAVHHWRRTAGKARGITMADLCQRRLEESARAEYSQYYQQQLANFLRRIVEGIGDWTLDRATPDKLAEYIHSRGKSQTQRYYKAILSGVFACAQRACLMDNNPASLVKITKAKPMLPSIMTPEEAGRWMACTALEAPSLLAGTAIALFAGLRTAEVSRLDWREVRLGRGFIEVTAAKSKTRTRRLVDIMPNLAEWLAPLVQEEGPVYPAGAARYRSSAVVRAFGGTPSKNSARHSFVSYHLALFGDVAKTELQAGHDRAVLFGHYRELVTQEEAEEYFTLVPS